VEILSIIYKRITQCRPDCLVFGDGTLSFTTINIKTTLYKPSWNGTVKCLSSNTTNPSVTSSLLVLYRTLHCLQSERRQHIFLLKFCIHLISFFYPISLYCFRFIWITPTTGSYWQNFRRSNMGTFGYFFSHFTSYGYKCFPKTVFPVLPTACMLRPWYSTNHTHITQMMQFCFPMS
jgi:hypothetical protein